MMRLAGKIRQEGFPGFRDVSVAYNSISIFFDPREIFHNTGSHPGDFILPWLRRKLEEDCTAEPLPEPRRHLVPVCYETPFATDVNAYASYTGLSREAIVTLHTEKPLYVFMVGFNPGFPYLGMLPDAMRMPRKAAPALKVPAGSVGIAGQQTGIYPNAGPGGWNIIGRTPLRLFDPAHPDTCLLQAGDLVQFTSIDATTFAYLNQYENP